MSPRWTSQAGDEIPTIKHRHVPVVVKVQKTVEVPILKVRGSGKHHNVARPFEVFQARTSNLRL